MASAKDKKQYLGKWIQNIPYQNWDSVTAIEYGLVDRIRDIIDSLSTASGDYVFHHESGTEIKRDWKGDESSKSLAVKLWRGIDFHHHVSGLRGNGHLLFDDIVFQTKKEVFNVQANNTGFKNESTDILEARLLSEYKEKLLSDVVVNVSEFLPIVLIESAVNEYVNTMYKEHKAREEYKVLVESNALTRIEKVQFLKDNIDSLSGSWDKVLGSSKVLVDFNNSSLKFVAKNILLIPIVPIVAALISPTLVYGVLGLTSGVVVYKVGQLALNVTTQSLGEGFEQRIENTKDVLKLYKNRMSHALSLSKKDSGQLWKVLSKDDDIVENKPKPLMKSNKGRSIVPAFEKIVLNEAQRIQLAKTKRLEYLVNKSFGTGDSLYGVDKEIERRINQSIVNKESEMTGNVSLVRQKIEDDMLGHALKKLKVMNELKRAASSKLE